MLCERVRSTAAQPPCQVGPLTPKAFLSSPFPPPSRGAVAGTTARPPGRGTTADELVSFICCCAPGVRRSGGGGEQQTRGFLRHTAPRRGPSEFASCLTAGRDEGGPSPSTTCSSGRKTTVQRCKTAAAAAARRPWQARTCRLGLSRLERGRSSGLPEGVAPAPPNWLQDEPVCRGRWSGRSADVAHLP